MVNHDRGIKIMRLIILAPPGGGKGTQASRLSDQYNIPQVETGKILRQAVQEGSQLGKDAKSYMSSGNLVPDEIMIEIIRNRFAEADCQAGFILDGFPRTLQQARALDKLLDEQEVELDAVIYLNVPVAVIQERLSRRRVCSDCGATYHLDTKPPGQTGICDSCQGELIQRSDDREEAIEQRLKQYSSKTEPLLEFYQDKGVLLEIDGAQSISRVESAIDTALTESQ